MSKRKQDYFEIPQDRERVKRNKNKKGKSFFKGILLAIALIVIALAVFVATIKIARPDFDFSTIVPKKVAVFVDEEILGNTTTATTAPTTTTTTTQKYVKYLEFEEFNFETSKQGNYLGNLLNGGKVGTDMTYIYHIADGKGIYRFVPYSEGYTCCYKTSDKLSCLNLRGDYLYFVNENDHVLYRLKKNSSNAEKIADDVKFVYVYDNSIYYVTNLNALYIMDSTELIPNMIYSADMGELRFVGISLERVFFEIEYDNNIIEFFTVDNAGKRADQFRPSQSTDELKSLQIENGFLYFYEKQDDESYNLIRQKFGSEKTVTLLENVSTTDFVIVDSNKVFYSDFSDNKFRMKELNMNTNSKKTMLSIKDAGDENELTFQHGGEYDYIIGQKENGDKVYSSSSMYTSSGNVMKFKNGSWKY